MRKEAKIAKTVTLGTVQGYHNNHFGSENYVYEGFESNKYYVSDRPIKLGPHFERPDGLPLEGFGLEMEQESFSITDKTVLATVMKKIIFPLFPADLFKMQADGSLGGAGSIGVECITQVMRKSFIRNHYNDFKAMYYYFKNFQISASRTGHCGMHVNVSNAVFGKTVEQQTEAIRKLHYFINKNYSFACKLLKRNENKTDYCGRMNYSNARTMAIAGGDHYVCMNYSHFQTGRIEIRLVGGQEDYYAFRNTMETIFFLTERVKRVSWEGLDNMVEFFKGCNQYVYKRLLDCDMSYDDLAKIKENVKEIDLELHH